MFKKIVNALTNISRLGRNTDWNTRLSPNKAGGERPVADSMGTGLHAKHDLSASAHVEHGYIVDAWPLARCYRVQPAGGGMTLDCAKGMQSGVTPIGVYDADTLVVGTKVRFMRLPGVRSGLIVATEPTYMHDPTKCMGDVTSMGAPTGLHTEDGPKEVYNTGGSKTGGTLEMFGGITDWSGRTPFDSLEIGELNRSTETGMMLHMDSYMAFMRANEYAGIWSFYWDGLTRVAGNQFQGWEGPTEREIYDDEGETMYYHGISPYPWEHQGYLTGPYAGTTDNTADDCQNNYPYYAAVEPDDDDLQPFHRFRTYAGYLGQGQKKLMCGPVLTGGGGGTLEDTLTYSDNYYMPYGLHEQQITMAGHWGVRNALGLTIAKRPVIPVPKRMEIVTSQEGDKPANYKASDYYGTGDAHKVQPTPSVPAGVAVDQQHLYRCNTLMDLHAHLFNWEGAHPFYYHENDYNLVEESAYNHVDTNQEVPNWDDLMSEYQWYLDVPDSDDIEYDHRTGGTARVYRNTAYFNITDEGAVVIGDGWGSEIRMAGGSIFLECPGDVFMAPGRNVIAWGGRDICLRAWNCVDISTSQKDVRIKAEQNLNMLGGNCEGPFGVFIETRSSGEDGGSGSEQNESKYGWGVVGEDAEHTGIVMKAKNSEIVSWARNIYLRTIKNEDLYGKSEGTATVGDQPKAGDIVLDTLGKGDVITRSSFVKHWVNCAVMHAFRAGQTARQVNFFTEDGATLCNDMFVDGDILNYGSHLARNDFISATGHMYSDRGGMVARADVTEADTAITEGHDYEATLRTWAAARWATDLGTMWYGEGRPGNDDVIKSAWFDMRVEEDYVSQKFELWEARWQQMARENSDTVNEWEEPPVESNREDADVNGWGPTYPFPGKQRLVEDNAYFKSDLKLYDTTTGESEDRDGGTYESPIETESPTKSTIDGEYYHIGK